MTWGCQGMGAASAGVSWVCFRRVGVGIGMIGSDLQTGKDGDVLQPVRVRCHSSCSMPAFVVSMTDGTVVGVLSVDVHAVRRRGGRHGVGTLSVWRLCEGVPAGAD